MNYYQKLLSKLRSRQVEDSRLNINPYVVSLLVSSEADINIWSTANDRFYQTEIGLLQLVLKILSFVTLKDLKAAQEVGLASQVLQHPHQEV